MKIIENLLKKGLTHKKLNKVKAVVIHWVANPGTPAANNRSYWENLGSGVSAHYIVDLNGDVLHCVPDTDMAYHVGAPSYTPAALSKLSSYPNNCTVGIEMTHQDWTGKPNAATYNSTVAMAAQLCKKFGLTEANIWTHHEIVGAYKDCHRWFTNNPKEWVKFKSDVGAILHGKAVSKPAATPVTKPAPKPAPAVKATEQIVLPASSTSWTAYKLGKPPVKSPANIAGVLNPHKFGGLTYDIIGKPAKDLVTIHTDSFGTVNLYVAPNTGAKIVRKK